MSEAAGRDAPAPQLERSLGLAAVVVYAVGDILGAGIYALVGQVAAVASTGAWASFVVAAVVAAFTALTYAELSSRFPYAAGAAAYTQRVFASPLLAFLVGVFVLASGVTSAATVSLAFLGYLPKSLSLPAGWGSVALLAAMSLLSFWGMRESARVNLVLTLVEVGGLVLVLVGAAHVLGEVGWSTARERLVLDADVAAVLGGATIAFFAFIGFEDTANIAEEVRDPSWVLPRAILIALAVTTTLYVAVAVGALVTLSADELAGHPAPLAAVVAAAGLEIPGGLFSWIALFAICNTGLLNLIMASRLAYGMARDGLLPAVIGRVHARRRTPWVGILVAFGLAGTLALSGGVRILAQTTSLLLLSVFATLHAALLKLKWQGEAAPDGVFVVPRWIPAVGLVVSLALLARYPLGGYLRALGLLAAGVLLFRFCAPSGRSMP